MRFNVSRLTGGHADSVSCLSLSDRYLCSGSDDGTVCLWTTQNPSSPVATLNLDSCCTAVKFHGDKPEEVFITYDCHLCCVDTRNLSQPIYDVIISEDEVNSVDLLESEKRLAAADDTGRIQIIEMTSGKVLRSLLKHDNICSCVQFRVNKTWQVISGGVDCRMVVSDWKGSGRGVSIFEMSELLDCCLDESDVEEDEVAEDYDDAEEVDESEEEESYEEEEEEEEECVAGATDDSDGENAAPTLGVRQNRVRPSGQMARNAVLVSRSLPVNPPMIHALACNSTGDFVAVGVGSSTVELFSSSGKHLEHVESLYGHTKGVSALHMVENDFLLSGGNDKNLFIWSLGSSSPGSQVDHGYKVQAIAGHHLSQVFVADTRMSIQISDLTLC